VLFQQLGSANGAPLLLPCGVALCRFVDPQSYPARARSLWASPSRPWVWSHEGYEIDPVGVSGKNAARHLTAGVALPSSLVTTILPPCL
jgi:hypothetical protein